METGVSVVRLFFDTEFTELGINPRLISIGLISEDGAREFYAELIDTYQYSHCSTFVRETVLPHLHREDVTMTMFELCLRLGSWIEDFEVPVQLVTDSTAWDWPWIQEIFCQPGTWPENLARQPESVYAHIDAQRFSARVGEIFKAHPDFRSHHALDDAKVNRLAWRELMT